MKKEKHSDISSRKKSNQKIIDSYDYLSNAASAQDCTGLIPVVYQSNGLFDYCSGLLAVPQTELSWNPTKKSIIIGRRKLIRRNVSDFYQPNKERFRSFCPKPFLIFTLVTTTIT